MLYQAIEAGVSQQGATIFASVALDATLKAAIVISGMMLLAQFLGKSSASARGVAWTLAMGMVLLIPALSATLPTRTIDLSRFEAGADRAPTYNVNKAGLMEDSEALSSGGDSRASESSTARALTPLESRPTPYFPSPVLVRVDEQGAVPTSAIIASSIEAARRSHEPRSAAMGSLWPAFMPHWTQVALVIWLAGLVIGLRRLVGGMLRAWLVTFASDEVDDERIDRELGELCAQVGITRRVRLTMCDAAVVPMTWGLFSPVIIVPRDAARWPVSRWRVVLLHELAHIARHDWLFQVINQFVCAIHWFNPLVWMAARQHQLERERACDDLVLGLGFRASDYAGHLVDIARGCVHSGRHFAAALSMARPSDLEVRVISILDSNRRRGSVARRTRNCGLCAAAALALLLSTHRIAVFAQDAGDHHDSKPAAVEAQAAAPNSMGPGWGWLSLGAAAQGAGDFLAAADGHARAFELGYRPHFSAFGAACAYAHAGDKELALDWLGKAIASGYANTEELVDASSMRPLLGEERFWELVKQAKENRESGKAKALLEAAVREQHNGAEQVADWKAMADHFASVVARNPDSGPLHFQQGYAWIMAGEYAKGLPCFERTLELGHFPDKSAYNIACCHARMGNKDRAFEWLDRAAAIGYVDSQAMTMDPDLETLREDPRFSALLDRLAKQHKGASAGYWYNDAQKEREMALAGREMAAAITERARAEAGAARNVIVESSRQAALEARMAAEEARAAMAQLGGEARSEAAQWRTEARQALAEAQSAIWSEGAQASYYVDKSDFSTGYALYSEGEYEEAINHFTKSYESAKQRGASAYNIACCYALQGKRDEAFPWLRKAVSAGFDDVNLLAEDDDLEILRNDPRFEEVVRLMVDEHVRKALQKAGLGASKGQ